MSNHIDIEKIRVYDDDGAEKSYYFSSTQNYLVELASMYTLSYILKSHARHYNFSALITPVKYLNNKNREVYRFSLSLADKLIDDWFGNSMLKMTEIETYRHGASSDDFLRCHVSKESIKMTLRKVSSDYVFARYLIELTDKYYCIPDLFKFKVGTYMNSPEILMVHLDHITSIPYIKGDSVYVIKTKKESNFDHPLVVYRAMLKARCDAEGSNKLFVYCNLKYFGAPKIKTIMSDNERLGRTILKYDLDKLVEMKILKKYKLKFVKEKINNSRETFIKINATIAS